MIGMNFFMYSAGIIQQMIQQSRVWQKSDVEVGLITARYTQADNQNFDRNAWSGPRLEPTASQLVDSFIPQPTQETQFMDGLVKGTSGDDLVRLDSVGGTHLYLKSEAVHQGLKFLTYAAVGTSWNSSKGWDGIETEGMCYVAKTLRYGCFGLGGTWLVRHTIFDFGVIPEARSCLHSYQWFCINLLCLSNLSCPFTLLHTTV